MYPFVQQLVLEEKTPWQYWLRCSAPLPPPYSKPCDAWGFYNSTNELLSGLDVTEHTAPAALVGLLHDAATD